MAELLAFAARRSVVAIADARAHFVRRRRLERAIAFLIDVLDAMDGDPDLTEQAEDNDPLDYGEHDDAELSGIGDMDGLSEQDPAWDGHLPLSHGGYVA